MAHTSRHRASVLISLLAVGALLGFIVMRSVPIAAQSGRVPVAPSVEVAVQALAAGGQHTCALLGSGGVQCWGYNTSGQLGDGTTTNRSTPVSVSGLSSGVIAITAGLYHTCALLSSSGVMCWGSGSGQLGDGTFADRLTPVHVVGLTSGVQAVRAGETHTCALLSGGGVQCWGSNRYGQLGDGTTERRYTPVPVSGLASGVQAIATGSNHTCALLSDSGAMCWGWNTDGQLGDSTVTDRHTPVHVSSLSSGVQAITAGYMHTCALLGTGGVMCWGRNNEGQLGDGTMTQRTTPVSVRSLTGGVRALAAGVWHTCALLSDSGAMCWGYNLYGQLGDGTVTDRHTPVHVSSLSSGVQGIAAGFYHMCALLAGGVQCWGWNREGQLGDGSTTNRITPVSVSGLSPGPTPPPTPRPTPRTRPDVNGNGQVSAVDSLCILRLLGGFLTASNCPYPLTFPDVNFDGQVTSTDALCVLRYLGEYAGNLNCPLSVIGAITVPMQLTENREPGLAGRFTLTPLGTTQLRVEVTVTGLPPNGQSRPAHIHSASAWCKTPQNTRDRTMAGGGARPMSGSSTDRG